MQITSLQNPTVKNIAKLKLKKYRLKQQQFLVESYYPILFALDNQYSLEELYICPSLFSDAAQSQSIVDRVQQLNIPVTEVSEAVFRKISYIKAVDGLLAVAPLQASYLKDYQPEEKGFYLIMESIEQLSNVGTLFRLADNAGATGVIVCNMRADIFHPGVIRSSIGTFFSVPIWQSTTEEAIVWCQSHQIKTLATTPHANQVYTDIKMTKPLAIVVGTEYLGLSSAWMEKADMQVKIPMLGQANSLSVTSTAAIMLYEVVRQKAS